VKLLIKEGGKHGVFEPAEERILQSVFEFTDMSVKEVMVPRHEDGGDPDRSDASGGPFDHRGRTILPISGLRERAE